MVSIFLQHSNGCALRPAAAVKSSPARAPAPCGAANGAAASGAGTNLSSGVPPHAGRGTSAGTSRGHKEREGDLGFPFDFHWIFFRAFLNSLGSPEDCFRICTRLLLDFIFWESV